MGRGVRFGLAAALLVLTSSAFRQLPARLPVERGEGFVPRPEVARLTALGFHAVLADYYWLQAVQVVGSALSPAEYAPVVARLVDVVTTLNPWVDHPYRFAALWLTDGEASVRQANRILERGISYHPRDWRNRFYLGFNHFFYLDDPASAAEVLEPAIGLPGSPLYLHRLVARLKAQTRSLKVAKMFLEELVRSTPDPYARAEYEKALDEIKTERRARRLDRARAVYRKRTGRDIARVGDLVRGPDAVLAKLPEELHGWEWVIDPESDRIVSSYYGHRYELQMHPMDRARREAWRVQRQQRGPGDEG